MKANRLGFSLTILFLVIVIAVVGSFLLWKVLGNRQNVLNQPQSNINDGYIVIKDWGIRFKPDDQLKNVEYTISGDTAYFSTQELSKFGERCTARTLGSPLGRLLRSKDGNPSSTEGGATIKRVGDYYYQYISPQADCSNGDAMAQNLEIKSLTLFKSSIATLEAY